MNIENIISALDDNLVYLMPPTELDALLDNCEIILERDTLISGIIRILKYGPYFITQESTPKNEIVLRRFEILKDAEKLVFDHLETYDQMWDGCGCKVNYYS